jgi:SAM-dependent methyltransferase
MSESTTTYDLLPYESVAFVETHPDRLAATATLFGIEPPSIERCRVLELGCSHGFNLIPMALTLPDSRFLGVDLSRRQIAEGQQVVEELGLKNVQLRAQSILEFGSDEGTFDYIICHGVFSWVPTAVQDRILDICSRQLAPNGIAFVSYNTYPGWFPRQMLRDMVVYHAAQFADPIEQVRESRAFLDYLAAAAMQDPNSTYGDTLRAGASSLRERSDAYVLHEYLEEINEPIYFYQFIDRIQPKGLRHFADARTWTTSTTELSPAALAGLARYGAEAVRREQCLDFLQRRTFRRSLLCHAAITPAAEILPGRIAGLYLTSFARLVAGVSTPPQFAAPDGKIWPIADPVQKEALFLLIDACPRSLSWGDFETVLRERLGASVLNSARAGAVCGLIRDTNLLTSSVRPPMHALAVGDRPVASPLVRLQARAGPRVTSLRHSIVVLNDFQRQLVQLLDGSRDRTDIAEALAALIVDGTIAIALQGRQINDETVAKQLVKEALEENLNWLVKRCLLVK